MATHRTITNLAWIAAALLAGLVLAQLAGCDYLLTEGTPDAVEENIGKPVETLLRNSGVPGLDIIAGIGVLFFGGWKHYAAKRAKEKQAAQTVAIEEAKRQHPALAKAFDEAGGVLREKISKTPGLSEDIANARKTVTPLMATSSPAETG